MLVKVSGMTISSVDADGRQGEFDAPGFFSDQTLVFLTKNSGNTERRKQVRFGPFFYGFH